MLKEGKEGSNSEANEIQTSEVIEIEGDSDTSSHSCKGMDRKRKRVARSFDTSDESDGEGGVEGETVKSRKSFEMYRKNKWCPVPGCLAKAQKKLSNHIINVTHMSLKSSVVCILKKPKKLWNVKLSHVQL